MTTQQNPAHKYPAGPLHIKSLVGIGVAVFALCAGATSLAVAQTSGAGETIPAAVRTFTPRTVLAADQGEAAAPTMTVAAYAAGEDGKVADGAKPLGSATNASTIRLGVTVEGFDAFPAGGFDAKTGKYVGDAKDQSAIALRISDGTLFNVSYGAFSQVKDAQGKVVKGAYEVKPNNGPVLALNGDSGVTFTVSVGTPVHDASKETPIDLDAFKDADGKTTITTPAVTHDTSIPAAANKVAVDGAKWLQGEADATKTALSNGDTGFTFAFPSALVNGETVAVRAGGNTVPLQAAEDGTFTWTPAENAIYDPAAVEVVTTNVAGTENAVKLADLLAGTPLEGVQRIVVDPAGANGTYQLAITGGTPTDVDGTAYYQTVKGATVAQDGNGTYFAIRAQLTKVAAVITTPDGKAHDLAVAGVSNAGATLDLSSVLTDGKLADGAYTIATRYPGTAASSTFTVDGTAPEVSKVTYAGDKANDVTDDEGVIAFGADKSGAEGADANPTRAITVAVKDAGSGIDVSGVTVKDGDESGAYKGLDGKAAPLDPSYYDVAVEPGDAGNATVRVTFKQPGTYDLGKITVAVRDRVGNNGDKTTALSESGVKTLALMSADNVNALATRLVVDPAQPTATVDGTAWYNKAPTLSATVEGGNAFSARLLAAFQKDDAIKGKVAFDINGKAVTYADLSITKDGRTVTWTANQPKADGKYAVKVGAAGDEVSFKRLFGDPAKIESVSFAVDTTAPEVQKVTYDADKNGDLANGKEVLAFNDAEGAADIVRTVTLTIKDAGVGIKDGSVVKVTGEPGAYTDLSGNAGTLEGVSVASFERDSEGTYTAKVRFAKPGSYDFAKIAVGVTDQVGNPAEGTRTAFTDINGGDALPAPLTLSDPALYNTDDPSKRITSQFNVIKDQDGNDPAQVNGLDWYNRAPGVKVSIENNPLADKIAAALAVDEGAKDVAAITSTLNDGGARNVAFSALDVSGNVVAMPTLQPGTDGIYQYAATGTDGVNFKRLFGLDGIGAKSFGLDTVAPVLAKVSLEDGASVNTSASGRKIFAAEGDRTVTIQVKDYLKGTTDDTKLKYASGVKDQKVTVDVPAPLDADGNPIAGGAPTKSDVTLDANGQGAFTLKADGLYDLNAIKVTALDNAGYSSETPLDKANDPVRNIQAVVAMSYPVVVDPVELTDQAPAEKNNTGIAERQGYYRGEVAATYTVHDMWFGLAQNAVSGSIKDADLTANSAYRKTVTDESVAGALAKLDVNSGWSKGDQSNGYTWAITKPVRVAGQSDKQEGIYNLQFVYQGLRANATGNGVDGNDLRADDNSGTFVMDWTAPTIGQVVIDPTEPVFKQLLFAEQANVTLTGISDDVATIRAGSGEFATTDANSNIANANALNADPHISGVELDKTALSDGADGNLGFTLNADSFRLYASGTSLAIADKAGNYASTGDFAATQQAFDGIDGIVIDTVAPTLDVTYDNNDVRNGKYYKAHRNGTVTIEESNLDLLQERDGGRVVVTTNVDGSQATIPLSEFKAAGDGKTYAATFAADRDGDWTVDATIADPLHAAATYHSEFTVDTVAPKLTLTFDNNDVRNGMYYAADRNATITEVERNFSEGESTITTTAKDDDGMDVPAPGAAGWNRTGGERESTTWTNTVAFTGEYHYTLKATATDLAGNVAQEVTEPEFVVDKTKPSIKIDRVEDKTAYAGEVAPLIDYDDTNIDKSTVTYTLEGAHRGELKDKTMPANATQDTNNSRTVDFQDFERKAEVDDVYTLTATAKDMAGNEFKTEKTFSANRFGSTYVFTAGTQNLRGNFIKKSQAVTVTEINVSGLEQGKSQVVVAKNDKATTLKSGEYTMKTGDDKGWTSNVYTIPAKNFAEDGYYRVQLQSVDTAGNLSQNTMDEKDADRKANAEVNFALDTTAPTASLLNVESGSVYYDQNGHDVNIDAKDNLGVQTTEIYIDGVIAQTWNGSDLLKETPGHVLAADAKSHQLMVRTVDLAGNEATASYDNIYVASNWWQYAMRTSWIRNTMIFAALIVVAAVVAALIAVSQRRKGKGADKDPFEISYEA